MEQTKALNSLEPFIALTKSATAPRAAADLVTRATSASGTYVFAELLETPQIQALAESPEYAAHLTQLQIFSYGTYVDYQSKSADLPPLNEQQTLKLRQLSLLTLAKNPHNLSYASLQSALGLADARAVEELVISAIYADLIQAQLDPRNQTVLVSSVSPLRDLAPGSIPSMLANLQEWSGRCTSTLADLEAQIQAIKETAAARHLEKKQWKEQTDKLVSQAETDGKGKDGAHSHNQPRLISRAVGAFRSGRGKRERPSSAVVPEDAGFDEMDVDDEDDTEDGPADSAAGTAGKKRASRRKF
ncbi:hypothetical protein G7054_g5866 [Neopestalotiopsis clavispora]|nr:hypothetical protein G7054_g5866 [Neopestalotiopsis clavispora]